MSNKESVRCGRAVFFVCFGVFCFALGYIDLGNRLFQTAGVTNVLLSCWNVGKIEALRWRRGGGRTWKTLLACLLQSTSHPCKYKIQLVVNYKRAMHKGWGTGKQ